MSASTARWVLLGLIAASCWDTDVVTVRDRAEPAATFDLKPGQPHEYGCTPVAFHLEKSDMFWRAAHLGSTLAVIGCDDELLAVAPELLAELERDLLQRATERSWWAMGRLDGAEKEYADRFANDRLNLTSDVEIFFFGLMHEGEAGATR